MTGRRGPSAAVMKVSDFRDEGMLHVATVRSPVSRGRIVSITIPHLPRDYRSMTADDIPGSRNLTAFGKPVPVLASGSVSYLGEPVALIAGPDRRKVHEAVRLTRVSVAAEEPAFGFERFESERVAARIDIESGDAEAALAAAASVVEGEYRLGAQDHYYPEPQGAAAVFDYDRLRVYASTQWPFHVRDSVAAALGVKDRDVVVNPTLLGPHMDGKLWYPSLLACHAALAAAICGRPALLLLSREEDFLFTTKRAPMLASYRAGLDADGNLVALDARIALNAGSYGPLAGEMALRAARAAQGPYACRDVRVRSWAVETNLPPMGAFAGIGTSAMAFATERLAEDCARAAGMDPVQWRLRALASRGDLIGGRPLRRSPPLAALSDRLLAMSDYPRKRASYELIRKRGGGSSHPGYGIGLAFAYQEDEPVVFGMDAAAIEVELAKDSSLTIRSSSVPGTAGTVDIWKRAAADIIGIDPARVTVAPVDTDRVPDSGPSTLSRNMSAITRLITAACEGIRSRRFREALPLVVRKSRRARGGRELEAGSWAGAVVELETDPLDGAPTVKGAWLCVDAGRILSGTRARHTLESATAVAIGQCVGEFLDLDGGPPDAAALSRYRLPRLGEAPPIRVEFMPGDDGEPGGIGELAHSVVPAAFANAMSQAMDRPWNRLPSRPQDDRPEGDRPGDEHPGGTAP